MILCGKAILKVVHDSESPDENSSSFCVRSYPKLYNVSQQWSQAVKFE